MTGSKSRPGSKFGSGAMVTLVASDWAPRSIVVPSGSARAAALAPTLPAAPPRLSTTTDRPHCSESICARMRAKASMVPPVENATTMRTGRVG
jgi:hypothetical protein